MTDERKIAALEGLVSTMWSDPLRSIQIPVSRTTKASVTFDGPVTPYAIDELVAALERVRILATADSDTSDKLSDMVEKIKNAD